MYDEINADFKKQNHEISKMFTEQNKGIKDMEPCLKTLERIHKQNSDLLEPIEHLTDEVIQKFYFLRTNFIILILILKIRLVSLHVFLFYFFIESFYSEYFI